MGLSTGNWSELRGKTNNIIWEKVPVSVFYIKREKRKKKDKETGQPNAMRET